MRYVVTMASSLAIPSAIVTAHDERAARIFMAAAAAVRSSIIVMEGGARVSGAV